MTEEQIVFSAFDPHGPFGCLILPPPYRKRIKESRFKQSWILTFEQYCRMMSGGVPFYQRGTIGHFQSTIAASAGPGGVVVLTVHNFTASTNGPCTSGVRFDNNGELFEIDSVTGNVQQDGEWWSLEPAGGIGNSFAVRALSAGKVGTWSNAAAADDVWITMNVAQRLWNVDSPVDSNKLAKATFEIGPEPTGPADDSAAIQCNAIDLGL